MPRIKKVIEEKSRQDNLDYIEARARVIKLMCQFFNPRNDIEYALEIEEIADALIEAAVLKCHLYHGKKDAAVAPKNNNA
ncbi:hypothetical protein [Myxosarcina sp. GI1(2024)]